MARKRQRVAGQEDAPLATGTRGSRARGKAPQRAAGSEGARAESAETEPLPAVGGSCTRTEKGRDAKGGQQTGRRRSARLSAVQEPNKGQRASVHRQATAAPASQAAPIAPTSADEAVAAAAAATPYSVWPAKEHREFEKALCEVRRRTFREQTYRYCSADWDRFAELIPGKLAHECEMYFKSWEAVPGSKWNIRSGRREFRGVFAAFGDFVRQRTTRRLTCHAFASSSFALLEEPLMLQLVVQFVDDDDAYCFALACRAFHDAAHTRWSRPKSGTLSSGDIVRVLCDKDYFKRGDIVRVDSDDDQLFRVRFYGMYSVLAVHQIKGWTTCSDIFTESELEHVSVPQFPGKGLRIRKSAVVITPARIMWFAQHLRPKWLDWPESESAKQIREKQERETYWRRPTGPPLGKVVSDLLAATGNVKVLQWAFEEGCGIDGESCSSAAARAGHVDILKFLMEKVPAQISDYTCNSLRGCIMAAARGGQLAMLQFLIATSLEDPAKPIPMECFHNSYWGALDSRNSELPPTSAMCKAFALGGHLHCLQWAVEENSLPVDAEICLSAAEGGHVKVLEWAVDQGCACNVDEIVICSYSGQIVTGSGQLYRRGGRAPIIAAKAGHKDVLVWLRDKGHTLDNGVLAAAAGPPGVPGCMDGGGHMALVEWLLADAVVPIQEKERAIHAAIAGNNLAILKMLRRDGWQYEEDVGTKITQDAARRGHLSILQFLIADGCPFIKEDCLRYAGRGHGCRSREYGGGKFDNEQRFKIHVWLHSQPGEVDLSAPWRLADFPCFPGPCPACLECREAGRNYDQYPCHPVNPWHWDHW